MQKGCKIPFTKTRKHYKNKQNGGKNHDDKRTV